MTKLYKILVTGPSVSGKTTIAGRLERDIAYCGLSVINKDVDYDKPIVFPTDADIFLLQTPHGAQASAEDGISLKEFDRMLYLSPDRYTHAHLLINRGIAWFRTGKVDLADAESSHRLPLIIKKVFAYHASRQTIVAEDFAYFNAEGIQPTIVVPELERGRLDFHDYQKVLTQILSDYGGRHERLRKIHN